MSNDQQLNERFEELVVTMVTEGLDLPDQQEFDQTDWSSLENDPLKEIEEFERAAAAFAIAFHSEEDSLPEDAQKKILENAKSALAGTQKIYVGDALLNSTPAKPPAQDETVVPKETVESVLVRPSWREGLALLAAAASIGFLIFNWDAFMSSRTVETVAELTVEERMAVFVESAPPDFVNVGWENGSDKDAKGRVVWSDSRQEGYMVFDGLDTNTPTKNQYQLWIFESPDQKYPIDGGVFDINSNGQVTVPIDPKIPVDKAVMFAVTVEKPGGVVVSDRANIPVLAKVNK